MDNEIKPEDNSATPAPSLFSINDDNFIDNGEAFFHISNILSMIASVHPQSPASGPLYVIVFNFAGHNLMVPFGMKEIRDEVMGEIKRRMTALKNGTIGKYIKEMKMVQLKHQLTPGEAA